MVRTKPSIRIKSTKNGLQIIKTMYNGFGKVMQKQIETIPRLPKKVRR
jgi:hypothetical protein